MPNKSGTVALISDVPESVLPAIGAHNISWQGEGAGTSSFTTTAENTQSSGSSFVFMNTGYSSNMPGPVSDSMGNTYAAGVVHDYAGYEGYFGARLYVCENGDGGAAHTVTIQKTGNPSGEITVPFVEIKNAPLKLAETFAYPGTGQPHVSALIEVDRPAYLVSFWLGDGPTTPATAVPSDGWDSLDGIGSFDPNLGVQCFSAGRSVGPGKYQVEWTPNYSQGAMVFVIAFSAGPSSSPGSSTTIHEATIDFGTENSRLERTFDVSIVGASVSDKVIAYPSLNMPAGIAEDELEMDMFTCAAKVTSSGIVKLTTVSLGGPVQGQRNINFILG